MPTYRRTLRAFVLAVLPAAWFIGVPMAYGSVPVATIDLLAASHPFPHFWETAFGSGRAVLTLRDSYRRDLRTVRDSTGMAYVRFHEIFEDDLGVYDEDAAGNPRYNFTLIDEIYDGLLAEGVRPIVELGWMPRKLAQRLDVHPFWDKPIVSPPKDWRRWDDLVTAFATHLLARYGREELTHWYFEVWNEPNIDFWSGEPKLATYLQLYAHSALALRAVDPGLRVGGPATAAAHWIPEFLAYVEAQHLPLDFVSTHGYSDDTVQDLLGQDEALSVDVRACHAMRKVRAEMDAAGQRALPLLWTEWNVASFGDALKARDTAYVGAAVAQTVADCDGPVQMLAFWTFSDVFDENGPMRRPFTGSFGLVGVGGIRKPAWTAFSLLHRLGSERLETSAPGTLVTRHPDGHYAIAVWNLQDPGSPAADRQVDLVLRGIPLGPLQVTTIDEVRGNSRAAYVAMGSPDYPSRAQVDLLNRAARVPAAHVMPGGDAPTVHLTLSPNALVMIESAPLPH